MTRVVFAIPGDLASRSGGYGYDRRVLEALPGCGVEAVHLALPGSFPNPGAQDVAISVAAINGELRQGDVVLIDGLAYGALPQAAIRAIKAPILALCHHPLCLETGLALGRGAQLRESEQNALALAAHIIVTSAHTGAVLARDFGASRHKISVAPPGTDPASRARGSCETLTLFAVGSIIPRKAFDVLVEALAGLIELDWRLRIAGSPRAAPQTSTALGALIEARALSRRVELLGELSATALDSVFAASDIFVSSSLYEGYGMALAEALARGLPIVTTTGGAAAETIPDAAALKVPPGDVEALGEALRRLIVDAPLRARLADASRAAGQALPRWEETARLIAKAVRDVRSGAR